jgi:ATP-dependent RNA helicase DeaD
LASFLPIVRELSEEYDAHAIAAAALQMAYDKTRPAWMQSEAPEEERSSTPKPIIIKRSQQTSVSNNN